MTTPPERKTNKMRKMWAPEEIMEDGINCWVVSSEGNGLDPIVVMTPESLSAMRRNDARKKDINSLKRRVKKLEVQMLGLLAMLKFYTETFASKIDLGGKRK